MRNPLVAATSQVIKDKQFLGTFSSPLPKCWVSSAFIKRPAQSSEIQTELHIVFEFIMKQRPKSQIAYVQVDDWIPPAF